VLFIQSAKSDAFRETEVTVIETLCSHIGTAIENALLYERAQLEIGERKRAAKALKESDLVIEAVIENIDEKNPENS
jgi:GAF domain-containing protein